MFKTQNEQYHSYSDLNKEEMIKQIRKIGYEKFYNKKPKPQKPMSKIEWKFRCFIHRVKRKIENFISNFNSYEGE